MLEQPPPDAAAAPDAGGDLIDTLSAVLDGDALRRLAELDPGGSNGLLPRVLKTFEVSLRRLLQQLQQARSADDPAAMRHVAHTLKSSSASVGALELSRICADIERAIRQSQPDSLPGLLDDMVLEGERVLTILEPVLKSE
jgi:HPt (histidine-containing phosphotransfer) domain-containing protein